MCVNEEVRRLGSVQRINDRCMEMQKNKHGENICSQNVWGIMAMLTQQNMVIRYLSKGIHIQKLSW